MPPNMRPGGGWGGPPPNMQGMPPMPPMGFPNMPPPGFPPPPPQGQFDGPPNSEVTFTFVFVFNKAFPHQTKSVSIKLILF